MNDCPGNRRVCRTSWIASQDNLGSPVLCRRRPIVDLPRERVTGCYGRFWTGSGTGSGRCRPARAVVPPAGIEMVTRGRVARGGSPARPARGTAGRSACCGHARLAVGRPRVGRQRRNRLETSCHRRRDYPARCQSDRRQPARRLQFTPLINPVPMVRALRRLCRLPDAFGSDRGHGDEIYHDQGIAHQISLNSLQGAAAWR